MENMKAYIAQMSLAVNVFFCVASVAGVFKVQGKNDNNRDHEHIRDINTFLKKH